MGEPEDFVICRICGAKRQFLSQRHFKSKNCQAIQEKLGISITNSREYKKMFPNVRTSSLKHARRMIETRHKNDPEKLCYYKSWKTRRKKYGASGMKDIENFRKTRSVINKRVYQQMSPEKKERRAKKIGKWAKQLWDSYTLEEKAERVRNARAPRHDISEERKQEIAQKATATRHKNDPEGESWRRAQETRELNDPQGLRFIKIVKTRWQNCPNWFKNPSEVKKNMSIGAIRRWGSYTPEELEEWSKSRKAFWESLSPEEQALRIRNSFGKAAYRPNLSENKLIPILEPLGFTYTGGGPTKIAGHKPDFSHMEYPLLIEYDGGGGHDPSKPHVPDNQPELDEQRDQDYRDIGKEILRILPKDIRLGTFNIQQKVRDWMISLGYSPEWEPFDLSRWFK